MAKKKVAGKRSSVDAEQFCTVWAKVAKAKGTVADVAKELNMQKNAVVARRNNYANKLKLKFPRLTKGKRLDTAKLQKILSS
jgi:hypothetical protein